MNRIDRAMMDLHAIDCEAAAEGWRQSIHPVSKVLVTLGYLVVLLSYNKYALPSVLVMGAYLIVLFLLGNVSWRLMGRRIWPLLLMVGLLGLANPFFDHRPMFCMNGFVVTGGMVSMLTLMLKGVFSMSAAYLLIVTTTMDDICHALRCLHVPAVLVTVLMLAYRYLMVLLKETGRLRAAYSMRSPGQRGISFRVWGSMVGQLLLRSIDRAEMIYGSMQLRGFQGEFKPRNKKPARMSDYLYALIWMLLLIVIRCL